MASSGAHKFGLLLIAAAAAAWLAANRPSARNKNSLTAQTIATQLTNYGGTEASGALSPDGRSFAFVSDPAGNHV